MQSPLQLTFDRVPHSERIDAKVREEVAKLEKFHERITAVNVTVSRPQHRHQTGDIYHIRLRILVPGGRAIAISREPAATGAHEDVMVAIRDVFRAARRRLQDRIRKQRGKVKTHEAPPHGRITALDPETDHGFIAAADGREIYFHRNAVAADGFDALEVGQEVRFSEAVGDKGPQATIVEPLGKHHYA